MEDSVIPERGSLNSPFPVQIGFVILSNIVDRDTYVASCLKTNSVSVVTADGSIYNECPIGSGFISKSDGDYFGVDFPDEVGQFGSMVVLLFPIGSFTPIVVAQVPKVDNYVVVDSEHQSKSIRDTDQATVTVVKDPTNGQLLISIYGKQSGMANLKIVAGSVARDAVVDIEVAGTLTAHSSGTLKAQSDTEVELVVKDSVKQDASMSLAYSLGSGLVYSDEFGNKIVSSSSGLQVQGQSAKQLQHAVYGEKLKDLLNQLLNAIEQLTVPTPAGPSGVPNNMASFTTIQNKLEEILTE